MANQSSSYMSAHCIIIMFVRYWKVIFYLLFSNGVLLVSVNETHIGRNSDHFPSLIEQSKTSRNASAGVFGKSRPRKYIRRFYRNTSAMSVFKFTIGTTRHISPCFVSQSDFDCEPEERKYFI